MQIEPTTDLADLGVDTEVTFTTETSGLGIPVDVTGRVIDVTTSRGDVFGPYEKTTVTVVGDDGERYELERTTTETYTTDIDVERENGFHPADQNCGMVVGC